MALGSGMSFIFDASKGETPASVARKRALVAQIMGQQRAPRTIGEGFSAIGDGIVANVMGRRADKAETAGQESANPIWDALTARMGGGSQEFPPAPGAPDIASQRVAQAHGGTAPDMSGNEVFSSFMDTVKAGGVTNPYALAAIAATGKRESGFSPRNANRTWSDPSERGQAGTAGGIMSWRGPRYQALAATGDLSPAGQARYFLQEDPQLIAALNNAKSPEEAIGLMNNAWKFAGYNRAGGEAAARLQAARSYLPNFQGQSSPAVAANEAVATSQPVQTASLDPSIGMGGVSDVPAEYAATGLSPEQWQAMNAPDGGVPQPNQINQLQNEGPVSQPQFLPSASGKGDRLAMAPGVDPGAPGAVTDAGQRVLGRMMNPQPMGGAPMPMQGNRPFNAVPAMLTGSQVAQAAPPGPDMSQLPVMAGGSADAIQPGQQSQMGGPSLQQLIQAASNPWLNDSQKQVVGMLLKQKMEEGDPSRSLDMRYKQAQIDALTRKAEGGNTEYGLNPIYGQDENGNPVLGTLGKDGTFKKIDTGGVEIQNGMDKVDLGTQWGLLNKRTGQIEGYMPKDLAGAEAEKAKGKGAGEAAVAYRSMTSKMPGLEKVVSELNSLADQATYTYAGQGLDAVMRQAGMEPREAAIARTKYVSMVDNQILPLLRDTFGAQFTVQEGESLRKTLGDPNKTPAEKKEVLEAFIEQKRRDVEALALQAVGGGEQAPVAAPTAPARLKFNPATGELE